MNLKGRFRCHSPIERKVRLYDRDISGPGWYPDDDFMGIDWNKNSNTFHISGNAIDSFLAPDIEPYLWISHNCDKRPYVWNPKWCFIDLAHDSYVKYSKPSTADDLGDIWLERGQCYCKLNYDLPTQPPQPPPPTTTVPVPPKPRLYVF